MEEESGIPEKVKKIAEKIRAADGVYISTPEYNYGFSAALKNIIDWLSRCKPAPLEGKPVTIVSTSAGPSGGLRVVYDLHKVLIFLKPRVMQGVEVAIPANYLAFDKKPKLNDEKAKAKVKKHIDAFANHIDWVRRGDAE